jgi:leader peptidase (prepilin peptidase)/N-methyltransferase
VADTLAILADPWWLGLTTALFGLIVGSFLNVVIHRVPIMLERQWKRDCREYLELPAEAPAPEHYNLLTPASTCPHCGHAIRWYENIPVLGWLALRGKCASCHAPIGLMYPLIELITALLSVVTALHFGPTPLGLAALGLTWALIALAVIDLRTTLLPDNITLPLLWAGLLASLWLGHIPLADAVIGAMAGYLSLWSVYQLFRLLTGKEGMGFGDFKLLAALGAWLGWAQLPGIILISSLVGALVGIALILFRRTERGTPIPFGPYLAAAGWIALIWGEPIKAWYLGLLNGPF